MSALQFIVFVFYFWLIRAVSSSYVHQQHFRLRSLAFSCHFYKRQRCERLSGHNLLASCLLARHAIFTAQRCEGRLRNDVGEKDCVTTLRKEVFRDDVGKGRLRENAAEVRLHNDVWKGGLRDAPKEPLCGEATSLLTALETSPALCDLSHLTVWKMSTVSSASNLSILKHKLRNTPVRPSPLLQGQNNSENDNLCCSLILISRNSAMFYWKSANLIGSHIVFYLITVRLFTLVF